MCVMCAAFTLSESQPGPSSTTQPPHPCSTAQPLCTWSPVCVLATLTQPEPCLSMAYLRPPPLALGLGASCPLARRLEDCALDGCNPLLEAHWARPRERRRLDQRLGHQRSVTNALIAIMKDRCTKAAGQQRTALLAFLALASRRCEACKLCRPTAAATGMPAPRWPHHTFCSYLSCICYARR